jgi:hypothetical protein
LLVVWRALLLLLLEHLLPAAAETGSGSKFLAFICTGGSWQHSPACRQQIILKGF